MKYERISKELFESNRKKLLDRMMNNSIAIFFSNDQMPTNADGTMPFKQNSDLLWLSGIDQEESKLIIYRDHKGEMTEHLFLKETSELIAIWEGAKLNKDQAFQTSGIKNVSWNTTFKDKFESSLRG